MLTFIGNTFDWINDHGTAIQLLLIMVVLPFLNKYRLRKQNSESVNTILGAMTRGGELAIKTLQGGRITRESALIQMIDYARNAYPDRFKDLPDNADAQLMKMADAVLKPIERAVKVAQAAELAPYVMPTVLTAEAAAAVAAAVAPAAVERVLAAHPGGLAGNPAR